MFLELLNQGIWPDILAYERLEDTATLCFRSPIAITRHNDERSVLFLFNRIHHFHSIRLLAQKQNFRTQPPKVLKMTVLLF